MLDYGEYSLNIGLLGIRTSGTSTTSVFELQVGSYRYHLGIRTSGTSTTLVFRYTQVFMNTDPHTQNHSTQYLVLFMNTTVLQLFLLGSAMGLAPPGQAPGLAPSNTNTGNASIPTSTCSPAGWLTCLLA